MLITRTSSSTLMDNRKTRNGFKISDAKSVFESRLIEIHLANPIHGRHGTKLYIQAKEITEIMEKQAGDDLGNLQDDGAPRSQLCTWREDREDDLGEERLVLSMAKRDVEVEP